MKNCLCPKWIALAVLALTICRLPYKFMEESGAVIWEKQFAFVISDCSRCGGKIKASKKEVHRPSGSPHFKSASPKLCLEGACHEAYPVCNADLPDAF